MTNKFGKKKNNVKPINDAAAAFAAAVKILSMRDYTAFELYNKLSDKGCSEHLAAAAVAECQKMGYIDDYRYAEDYITVHQRVNLRGPLSCRRELLNKGVAAEAVSLALEEFYPSEREAEVLTEALEEARERLKEIDDRLSYKKERERVLRRYLSKGFSLSAILRGLE